MSKILVILGHPRPESYCGALSRAYAAGAQEVGHQVETLVLADLVFDPILRQQKAYMVDREPDLKKAQDLIVWAEHMVWVYPLWWGSRPALLQGFIDRTIHNGFAYQFHAKGPFWDKLLTGRSARLIVTMDTPPWYFRWLYGDCGIRSMKQVTLGFCGIHPVHVTRIGSVRQFSEAKRLRWLEKVRQIGAMGQ